MPSTAIRGFRYDADSSKLHVTFVSGQQYVYFDVPAEVDEAFRAAFSKGRFFQTRIRDRYAFERLSDAPFRTSRRSTGDPLRPWRTAGR